MQSWLVDIDTDIFLWINSHHSSAIDLFMFWISTRIVWIPLYLSMLYAVFLSYGWRSMIIMGICAAIAVAAADQLSASILRPAFERLRPAHPDNPISSLVHVVNDYRGGRYGFPSCHASNTFAAATLTSLIFRRLRFTLAIFFWALTVSYSRLYLGVHYPGDILAGSIIGYACGTGAYVLARIMIGPFIRVFPYKREARQIIATWKRGAPQIKTEFLGHRLEWRPTTMPIYVIFVSFIIIACFTIRIGG